VAEKKRAGDFAAAANAERRILLGVIAGAHGVAGHVRIKSFTEAPESLVAYGPLRDSEGREYRLRLTGKSRGLLLARIEGVSDRNQAEALAGRELGVARSAFPEPDDPDEFYEADLIGLRAEREDGQALGRVSAVADFGAGPVLTVTDPQGAESMFPFTAQVVPKVDLAAGRLTVLVPGEAGGPEEGQEAGAPKGGEN
jgi:16S rRNA processing protein RimM